jgi:hypothetical protein
VNWHPILLKKKMVVAITEAMVAVTLKEKKITAN